METKRSVTTVVKGWVANVMNKPPKPLSRSNIYITVNDDSMCPKYLQGDIIVCCELQLCDMFFQWGRVYAFQTMQGDMVKKVLQGHDGEHILLVSENPKYEPFELHISQIKAFALSQGVIRLE